MVSEDPSNTGRNPDGTFIRGSRGNPAGKPKGARHRATVMAEKLFAADTKEVVKKVVEAAKNGKSWACKLIIERLIGPAREAPGLTTIGPVDYAEPRTAAEARAMIFILGGKVARGEISVEAHDVLLGNLRAYLADRAAELEAVVEKHRAEENELHERDVGDADPARYQRQASRTKFRRSHHNCRRRLPAWRRAVLCADVRSARDHDQRHPEARG